MVQPNPNEIPCQTPVSASAATDVARGRDVRDVAIPEIEEFAEVSKRVVETGVVRITKHIEEVDRTFHPTLHEQHVRVERVPVNRVVKSLPEVRTEGDTTIVPVVEEVVVKLLLLKEEVRITRENVNKTVEPQHVTLRREHVEIDRRPADGVATKSTER